MLILKSYALHAEHLIPDSALHARRTSHVRPLIHALQRTVACHEATHYNVLHAEFCVSLLDLRILNDGLSSKVT